MKTKPAWVEVIPALCGDSYAMSDAGVCIHASKEEIEKEIKDLEDEYRHQADLGERDPDDCEVDSYPLQVLLTDTGRILDVTGDDITDQFFKAMRDVAGITDTTLFVKEIIDYVKS